MTFELNNFSKETISWKIYQKYEIFGIFDLGSYLPSYSGSFDVNLPGYVYRNTGLMGNAARHGGISNSVQRESEYIDL